MRASVDIAYFREGEAILEAGMAPTHLFVVIKGFVQQFEHGGSEAVASFGPARHLRRPQPAVGQVGGRFVAAEEVLAYQLARQVVTELIARNATFGALLFSDLSNKLAAIAGRVGQHELQSLALARVDTIPVRRAARRRCRLRRAVGGAAAAGRAQHQRAGAGPVRASSAAGHLHRDGAAARGAARHAAGPAAGARGQQLRPDHGRRGGPGRRRTDRDGAAPGAPRGGDGRRRRRRAAGWWACWRRSTCSASCPITPT